MVPRHPLVQSWCTKEQPYCKSQLEPIIEHPGNTQGGRTSFWSLIRRRTVRGFSSSKRRLTSRSFLYFDVTGNGKWNLDKLDVKLSVGKMKVI